MKKVILFIENIFLVIQIIMFSLFIVFTAFSCMNSENSIDDFEFVLVVSIVYFFITLLKSVVFSKMLKLDLSYKGPNTFAYVSKPFKWFWAVLFIVIAICSIVFKIHYYFVIASILNCFSIVLQYSYIKYFKLKG